MSSVANADLPLTAPQQPAQQPPPPPPRDGRRDDRRDVPWEVTASGGGTNDEDFNVGNGSLNASVGYYFTEMIELVGRQTVFYSDDEGILGDDEDVWAFQSMLGLDLHIPLGKVVPYVGGSVGFLYGDIPADETMAAGPEAGVKIYLQRAAFFHAGAAWQFFFDEQETIDDAFTDGQIFYTVGFGLRF